MEKKNLIVPLVGDFAGPKTIRTVGQYLKDHDATVTAFYLSNVEQYFFMQGNDWLRFYPNVETLPMDSSSTFIRSVNGGNLGFGGFGGLRFQRCSARWPALSGPSIRAASALTTTLSRCHVEVSPN